MIYVIGSNDCISKALVLALTLTILPCSSVVAQSDCDASRLKEAAGLYDFGLFVQTLELLKPCVPEGFPEKTQRISAYKLMALSYIVTDSSESARAWVRRLLEEDARYKSDPEVDPSVFIGYVRDLKPRWYTWLWRGGEWYKWVGRSLLAGSVVSLHCS